MSLITQARLSFRLGILSLFAVVLSHMALTDISHGEQDLTLEWRALQMAFGAIIVFQFSALAALRRVLREEGPGATSQRAGAFTSSSPPCRSHETAPSARTREPVVTPVTGPSWLSRLGLSYREMRSAPALPERPSS